MQKKIIKCDVCDRIVTKDSITRIPVQTYSEYRAAWKKRRMDVCRDCMKSAEQLITGETRKRIERERQSQIL